MPAHLVHLVRHGEVENPDGVLYGRIEGFGLSVRGHRMAQLAAESLAGHDIRAIAASPLQRTRESAAPWVAAFGVDLARLAPVGVGDPASVLAGAFRERLKAEPPGDGPL